MNPMRFISVTVAAEVDDDIIATAHQGPPRSNKSGNDREKKVEEMLYTVYELNVIWKRE